MYRGEFIDITGCFKAVGEVEGVNHPIIGLHEQNFKTELTRLENETGPKIFIVEASKLYLSAIVFSTPQTYLIGVFSNLEDLSLGQKLFDDSTYKPCEETIRTIIQSYIKTINTN